MVMPAFDDAAVSFPNGVGKNNYTFYSQSLLFNNFFLCVENAK